MRRRLTKGIAQRVLSAALMLSMAAALNPALAEWVIRRWSAW